MAEARIGFVPSRDRRGRAAKLASFRRAIGAVARKLASFRRAIGAAAAKLGSFRRATGEAVRELGSFRQAMGAAVRELGSFRRTIGFAPGRERDSRASSGPTDRAIFAFEGRL